MDQKAEVIGRRMTAMALRWLASSGIFIVRTRRVETLLTRILASDARIRTMPRASLHELYSDVTEAGIANLTELKLTRNDLHDVRSELERTTASLKQQRLELNGAEGKLAAQTARINELHGELGRSQGTSSVIKSELAREQAAHETSRIRHRKELAEITAEVERLRAATQTSEAMLAREQAAHERGANSIIKSELVREQAAHETGRIRHRKELVEVTAEVERLRGANQAFETLLASEQAVHKKSLSLLETLVRESNQGQQPVPAGDDIPDRDKGSEAKAGDAKAPLAAVVWDINTRFYTDQEFLSVREQLERTPATSGKQAAVALETLRQCSDEDAIRDYFLAISDRVISTNHHLPAFLKYSVLRKIGRALKLKVFVETGTFYADACRFLRDDFQALYTIDIDPWCVTQAVELSKQYPQVKPLQGDSGEMLTSIAQGISEPALFFLDGHCTPRKDLSGYGSMSSPKFGTTPVLAELEAVAARKIGKDAIIIDDVACFENHDHTNYPAIRNIMEFCQNRFPSHRCSILYGMFFIVPAGSKIKLMGHDL